jgi:hypothetical protein
MLVITFVALLCLAVVRRVAIARHGPAEFNSASESLFSFGGCLDPFSFLVLQAGLLILASVVGWMIGAQARGTAEGWLLAFALFLAALPIFVRAELAICIKRRRDVTAMWPSYGVLVWAAFLLLSLVSGHNLAWVEVVCWLALLAACIWWYIFSRRLPRRGFILRAIGYLAFGLGSRLALTAGFTVVLGRTQHVSSSRISIVVVACFLFGAGLITASRYLIFRIARRIPSKTAL